MNPHFHVGDRLTLDDIQRMAFAALPRPEGVRDALARTDVLLTTDEWVDHFEMSGNISFDGVETALSRVGRNEGPVLLAKLFQRKSIPTHLLRAVIGTVWSMAECPDWRVARDVWLDMFAEAGYTSDGSEAELPRSPLTLWRGSVAECRRNWSWTADREVAIAYASGGYRRARGRLWRANVHPWRLLAHITERGEAEYVVNTRGLQIVCGAQHASRPREASTD